MGSTTPFYCALISLGDWFYHWFSHLDAPYLVLAIFPGQGHMFSHPILIRLIVPAIGSLIVSPIGSPILIRLTQSRLLVILSIWF